MNILHMRFTADTYYGNDSRRYLKIYFRPKKWPQDRERVRYFTVYMDSPDASKAADIAETLCPGFGKAMDLICAQAVDEYGVKGELDAKTKKEISKAREWEDDSRLLHAYKAEEGS